MEHPTVICALIGRNAGHGIGDINFAAILSAMQASADAGGIFSTPGHDGATRNSDVTADGTTDSITGADAGTTISARGVDGAARDGNIAAATVDTGADARTGAIK